MATKLKPVTDKLTKTQIQDQIAECTGLARKQVASVLDCLGDVIKAHLTQNAVGEFVLPGLLKITTVRKPAVKERTGIDPFTKQEKVFKAKPASSAVKVRPLKGLKDMAGWGHNLSILDMAMAGTSATLLARKWESALLVNVDNDTLRRIMENPEAMAAVERIEGWRALGDNVLETIINKSDRIKELKKKAKEKELTKKEKKELSDEEKEFKSKRKLVQEKLIKFATRIPAFMYLTDFRENTLQDVITKIETGLFETVTGLTVKDFHLLVRLKVFNTEQMNQAVFAFRRYEDASLRYTGIESHKGLSHYGLYDTVVARE